MASIACLRKLADPQLKVYETLDRLTAKLVAGIEAAFAKNGVTASVVRQGSAHSYYFMAAPPTNWWQLVTMHDFQRDARLRKALIARGIYYFPTPTKQGSVSFRIRTTISNRRSKRSAQRLPKSELNKTPMKLPMIRISCLSMFFLNIALVLGADQAAEKVRVACLGDSITFGYGIKDRDTRKLSGAIGDVARGQI